MYERTRVLFRRISEFRSAQKTGQQLIRENPGNTAELGAEGCVLELDPMKYLAGLQSNLSNNAALSMTTDDE